MSACIHQHLSVDRGCILLQHQGCVKHRDRLKSQRVAAAESQELDVDLRELYVELAEVTDVIREKPVNEVALDELILEGVLVRA